MFRKNKSIPVIEGKETNKTTSEIIQEIHTTFYTEVDRLKAMAEVKSDDSTDKQELLEKDDRLSKLGFTNSAYSKQARKEKDRIKDIQNENENKDKIIEAINYFKVKYPFYKFITEDSVKKICEKYNLIYGDVSRYIGTVPDKNIEQMEKFSVKKEDIVYLETYFGIIGGSKTEEISYERFKAKGKEEKDYFNSWGGYRLGKAPLEICAPVKDFNTEGMELKNFKLSKIEIPDPVVLQPVMHKGNKYYLIVTAWGDEASDELVVNEVLN